MIFENFIYFFSKVMFFSSYVETQNSFEQPLSDEEENKLILLCKNGDNQAREKLIKHNLRLVAHVVKKYSNAGEADDLISVGCVGLIKAINSFEPGKGTMLSTYSARCIENEILMLIRANKKYRGVISLNDTLGKDKDGDDVSLKDVIEDDNTDLLKNSADAILSQKMLDIISSVLTTREREIICYRYGLGGYPVLTQREIALKLNISRSYISRIEKKALQDLKKVFDNEKI